MIAMQYGFDFPDSFDMGAIRRRAIEIGPRFDTLRGLRYKGFLVRDRTTDGAGRYTPFYAWADADGMREFLAAPAFQALVDKYGRPAVATWLPLAEREATDAAAATPRFATQHVEDVPAAQGIEPVQASATALLERLARQPGFHTGIATLDAATWRWMVTVFWTAAPAQPLGRLYDVPWFSRPPHEAALPNAA